MINDLEEYTPLWNLLTRDTIFASPNYSFLAVVGVSFRTLPPVFFATPVAVGGLGLDPPASHRNHRDLLRYPERGPPRVSLLTNESMMDYFGVKLVYLIGVKVSVPCFALFPVVNYLARSSIERSSRL